MKYPLVKKMSGSALKVFLMAAVMMFITSFTIFAAAELDVEQLEDDSVIISGMSGASLKRNVVTLYIEDSEGEISHADSDLTNADGSFSFTWVPNKSDDYNINVKAGVISYNDSFWYTSVKEQERLMELINSGTASDIASVLSSESSLKTIGAEPDILGEYSADEVAQALYHIREYKELSDSTLDYVDEAKVFAEFIKNSDSVNLEKLYKTAKTIGIELGDYNFFKEIKNEKIAEYALESFGKELYTNMNSADTCFRECIILAGVYNCTSWTELDDYLALLEYSKYNNSKYKEAAAKAVASVLYDDAEKLKKALSDAIDKAGNSGGGGGSSSGGSSSSSGGSGGSSGGGGKRPATINTMVSAAKSDVEKETEEKIVFNDVKETHWAFEAVNYLRWNSTVVGDDFNCFYPDSMITRAEMCAMLTRAYSISGGECDFTDVPADSWYYAPISAAYSAGLVQGYGEQFMPEENITRQDMAVLIYRFAVNSGKTFETTELSFADNSDISDYAAEAIAAMYESKMINGVGENRFAPMENATRAQAAKLIYEAVR